MWLPLRCQHWNHPSAQLLDIKEDRGGLMTAKTGFSHIKNVLIYSGAPCWEHTLNSIYTDECPNSRWQFHRWFEGWTSRWCRGLFANKCQFSQLSQSNRAFQANRRMLWIYAAVNCMRVKRKALIECFHYSHFTNYEGIFWISPDITRFCNFKIK